MSVLDRGPALGRRGGTQGVAAGPVHEVLQGKTVQLGPGTPVRRVLPNLGRRLVGAWCFVDHYGPNDIATTPGMQVPPHPHIGLQTVSWLLEGTVHHRDSLGHDVVIEPGALGLMTAGSAITHAEQSPVPHPALLHGVQLWIALPGHVRNGAAAWEHHAGMPVADEAGGTATLIVGEVDGTRSSGTVHTPLVGTDLAVHPGGTLRLPLEPDFEHAAMIMDGTAEVDGVALGPGSLLYLGTARREVRVTSAAGARVLLIGGLPFDEQIVMWWNFVARDNDEIVAARTSWEAGDRFGDVAGFDGVRQQAPSLPAGRLRPGGATR